MSYDCSYKFDKHDVAKKYKYIVITSGDLDINNAVMLRTKKDLMEYLKSASHVEGIIKVDSHIKFETVINFPFNKYKLL